MTGAQIWAEHYNDPSNGGDRASSVAVSSGGSAVFVTGASDGDYGTVAYNALSGAQLWVTRYSGPGNRGAGGSAVAVSPRRAEVFVTGSSRGATTGSDYATIAYRR